MQGVVGKGGSEVGLCNSYSYSSCCPFPVSNLPKESTYFQTL